MDWENAFFYLTFLHATGLSLNYVGIIWYIGPFFWISLFIIALIRTFNTQKLSLLLAIFIYFGYTINIQYSGGGLGRAVIWSWCSLATIRILAGLSLGVILAIINQTYSNYQKIQYTKLKANIQLLFYTSLELLLLILIFRFMLYTRLPFKNVLTFIVFFSFLFLLFINKKGLISSLLNIPVFNLLGRYSYSIYVMQQVAFYILAKTLWRNSNLMSAHPYYALIISFVFSIILGIVTYHLIERPIGLFLKKRFKFNYDQPKP